MKDVKVQFIHEDAKMPYRANPGDAGLDLFQLKLKQFQLDKPR